MQKSIDSLAQSLQSNHKVIADPFTQTHSPLSITEKGHEMIKRIGMDKMFESNWERIKKLIEECSESKNPYDIQQFCMQQAVVFPEKFLSEKQLDTLKTDAYNTGIPLTSYMKVWAVLSRDRYFKENGIDISEVDKRKTKKELIHRQFLFLCRYSPGSPRWSSMAWCCKGVKMR